MIAKTTFPMNSNVNKAPHLTWPDGVVMIPANWQQHVAPSGDVCPFLLDIVHLGPRQKGLFRTSSSRAYASPFDVGL